ncbi:methyl-accepting chemotaxis protein [Vibrio sp. WXL210]|uniref:methyl-accepting chemotaxis protein n=1 Tax=Vibrio sp. WXL210 TaxID=3450709 RepID=UPI003EC6916B
MKVSQKIWSISLLAIICSLAVSMSSYWTSKTLINDIQTIQVEGAIPLAQLKGIADTYAVSVIDALNKAHLEQSENLEPLFNQIDQTLGNARQDWDQYRRTNMTAQEQSLAERTEQQFRLVVSNLALRQQALTQNQLTLPELIIATYTDTDELNKHIDALIEMQLDMVAEIHRVSSQGQEDFHQIRLVIIALGIGLFSLISHKIISTITGLLGAEPELISEHLRQMAKGDFSPIKGAKGKPTGVYKSLIELVQGQNALLTGSHSMSNSVASAAEELSCVMQETAANAQMEKAQIETVSAAITQLSATVQEMNGRTQDAENAANLATQSVKLGSTELQRSVALTQEIDNSINHTAAALGQLKEDTQTIEEVVDVISQISEQTNLLALNAAIEAARAGEQGRGFAVVADEVRNLAAKTQQSTQRIQAMITSFQEQAELANQNMLDNQKQIESSVKLAESVESAFDEIQTSVVSISEINALVASASQEQLSVTQEVAKSSEVIMDLVNQNASAVAQTQQASAELAKLSNQQKQDLAKFKLA